MFLMVDTGTQNRFLDYWNYKRYSYYNDRYLDIYGSTVSHDRKTTDFDR